MWQDWLIALAHIGFIKGAFGTIRHPDQKPPLLSALEIGAGNAAVAVAYAGFGAWVSVTAAFILSIEWTLIAHQRYRINVRSGIAHFNPPKLLIQILMRD